MVELTFRPPTLEDFDGMHETGSHWSVVRQLGSWPWPPDPNFTRSRCKPYDGEGFVLTILADGVYAGGVAVTGKELGYSISPRFHGKGIGTRAARHAISRAFADYDWPELQACCWHDNIASKRLLEKSGFVHWQTHYDPSFARRRPVLLYRFRLSRARWDSLSNAAQ